METLYINWICQVSVHNSHPPLQENNMPKSRGLVLPATIWPDFKFLLNFPTAFRNWFVKALKYCKIIIVWFRISSISTALEFFAHQVHFGFIRKFALSVVIENAVLRHQFGIYWDEHFQTLIYWKLDFTALFRNWWNAKPNHYGCLLPTLRKSVGECFWMKKKSLLPPPQCCHI